MATSGQWQTSSQFSQGQEGREERLGKRPHRDSQMVLSAICYCGGNGAMPRPVRFRFNWGCFHLRVGCAMHARVVFIVILRISGASTTQLATGTTALCVLPISRWRLAACQLDTQGGLAGVPTCELATTSEHHDVAPCTDARRQRVGISSAHAHVMPWFDARLPPNDSNK